MGGNKAARYLIAIQLDDLYSLFYFMLLHSMCILQMRVQNYYFFSIWTNILRSFFIFSAKNADFSLFMSFFCCNFAAQIAN